MPHVQDDARAAMVVVVGPEGTTPTLNDLEPPYLDAITVIFPKGTVQDQWHQYWDELTISPGNYNDRAFEWHRGKLLTGSLNDMWKQYWGSLAGSGLSDEVIAVLARYSALDAGEIAAITAYVDGLVADGSYSDITEIYAPCLNATDWQIGFKFMSLVIGGSPTHVPGEYIDFAATDHVLDSANYSSFATIEGFVGCYCVWPQADTTGNSDILGVLNGTNETYLRWRGTDTNDFNASYNVTSVTPRTAANQRPTGDLVGMGLEGTDLFELQPGGVIVKATRVQNIVPTGFPMQWHGRNVDGTPAGTSAARYSLMIHSNALFSTVVQGSVRARSLQFLRDIGVTGVPAT